MKKKMEAERCFPVNSHVEEPMSLLELLSQLEASSLEDDLASPDTMDERCTSMPGLDSGSRSPISRSRSLSFKRIAVDENGSQSRLAGVDPKEASLRVAELESLEACYWLKAAGFPQYAQSYEDGGFPIDIVSVIKEHDFLDQDSIQSLHRRLHTLNKCAKMNLHIKSDGCDSDEEDLIALSSRWKLQNKTRRWSRKNRSPTLRGVAPVSLTAVNSHNGLNSAPGNTRGQKTLRIVDRKRNKQITTLSHLDLCLAEERASFYDNLPPSLSASTPSISNVGKELNHRTFFDGSNRTHKRNLASSADLDQFSASSNDELSDYEQDDDLVDLPGDLMKLRSVRTNEEQNTDNDSQPKSHRAKVRWHSFERTSRPEIRHASTSISALSAGQLAVLRKYSLLKLTALIERCTHPHRGMWHWSFPHFLKKLKTPDYRDKNVFGVPLSIIVQRTGQPLPKSILFAINYIQRTGADAEGIFRKSGGKQRISHLREMIEADPDNTNFEGLSPFDMADMLKQYFRELPEPILTSKLAETLITVFTSIPSEFRVEALQAVIILMPDENREALQTLLLFLNEIASNALVNKMSEKNLGMCFAPSLFHLFGSKDDPSAPKRQKRTPMSKASKELTENLAAHECLGQMISQVDKLFTVPQDTMVRSRFSYIQQGDPVPLSELGRSKTNPDDDHHSYIETCIAGLLKESRDRFKGWAPRNSSENGLEISYKKVRDGYPLRLWRAVVEIHAKPEEILRRILDERHLWDEDLATWDVIERLDETTDVFYYETQSMILQPKRNHIVLRSWRSNLERGCSALVCTSISHPHAPAGQGVRATVLASRYLMEPLGNGRSRVTHISRVDQRGRTPEFYSKALGPFLAASIGKVRESFQCGSDGPETKV